MTTLVPARWRAGLWPTMHEGDPFETRLTRLFEPFDEAEGVLLVPTVDVQETEDAMTLTAELPGMDGDDVEIAVENNVLTMSGEKKQVRESDGAKSNMRIWERRYGKFSRSFTLPNTIDAEHIKAEFDKGVLTVTMPKRAEAKGRRIAIKAR